MRDRRDVSYTTDPNDTTPSTITKPKTITEIIQDVTTPQHIKNIAAKKQQTTASRSSNIPSSTISNEEKQRIDTIIANADKKRGGAPSISGGEPVDTTPRPPTGASSDKSTPKKTDKTSAPSFKWSAPVGAPTPSRHEYTTGAEIKKRHVDTAKDILHNITGISSTAQYETGTGKILSGAEVQQQMGMDLRNVLLGIPGIPGGSYVEKEGQYYGISPELRYTLEHAEPGESKQLFESIGEPSGTQQPGFVGPIHDPFASSFQKAYGSLTEEEKTTYGFTYHPFTEGAPVEEWKYHPGGSEYIKSLSDKQKKELTTSFLDTHKIEHDPWYALGSTWRVDNIPISGLRTEGLKDTEIASKIALQELTMSPTEINEMLYANMPGYGRKIYSAGHFVASNILWPVTTAQSGVKLITKGATLLPDISSELSQRQLGPVSHIETTIGGVLGQDVTYAKEMQSRYPTETWFATGGSLFGMWLGGKTIGGGMVAATKLGIKATVGHTRPFLSDTFATSTYRRSLTEASFKSKMYQKGMLWDQAQGGWTKLGDTSILQPSTVAKTGRQLVTLTKPKTNLFFDYKVWIEPKTTTWTSILTKPYTAIKGWTMTGAEVSTSILIASSLKTLLETLTQPLTRVQTKPLTLTFTKTQTLTQPLTKTQTLTQPLTFTRTITLPFLPLTDKSLVDKPYIMGKKKSKKEGARYRIHPVELFEMNIKLPEVNI